MFGRQNLSHRSAHPPSTIAQLMLPWRGDTHQAAVRLPPADPSERHRKGGPLTRTCPCRPTPVRVPNRSTSASRAAIRLAAGQGCPDRQLPSSSRAAIPASLNRGSSRHQTNIGRSSPAASSCSVKPSSLPQRVHCVVCRFSGMVNRRVALGRLS